MNPGPFPRPFPVGRVTPEGVDTEIAATREECDALARDLGLPALHELAGRFRLKGFGRRIQVTGRITASIEQVCVVSLDLFASRLDEEVEVAFEEPRPETARVRTDEPQEIEADLDQPEELVGDKIDLGAIAAEFLALGLDPYPKKPGTAFEAPAEQVGTAGPFAGLALLKSGKPEAE